MPEEDQHGVRLPVAEKKNEFPEVTAVL